MHRGSVRLDRLEAEIRRQQSDRIDRIATFIENALTPDELALFCSALAKDIEHGPRAQFTEPEIDAMLTFDRLAAQRPDIGRLIAEVGGHYGQN